MPVDPFDEMPKIWKSGPFLGMYLIIMPSKMEVASQHCDTVPNQTKDILDNVKIERIFIF